MAIISFEQFAIKADLSDDKYPYSNLSFNSRKCIKYGLIFSAISGIITYAIRSLLYYIAQNTQNSETATNATATTADATSGGFQNMLPNFELPRIDFVGGLLAFHDWLSSTFNYLIWFTVISIAVYLFSGFCISTPSRVSSGFFVETFFAIYSCGDSSGFSSDSLFIYFSIEPKYNKDKCYKPDSVL